MKKLATTFGLLALMLVVTSFTTPVETGGKQQPIPTMLTYETGGKQQPIPTMLTYETGGKQQPTPTMLTYETGGKQHPIS